MPLLGTEAGSTLRIFVIVFRCIVKEKGLLPHLANDLCQRATAENDDLTRWMEKKDEQTILPLQPIASPKSEPRALANPEKRVTNERARDLPSYAICFRYGRKVCVVWQRLQLGSHVEAKKKPPLAFRSPLGK